MIKNKCVFLVTINEDIEELPTEAFTFKDIEDANNYLHEATFGNLDEESTRIYHGTIIAAKFMPDDFNGITPYLLIHNPQRFNVPVTANEVYFERQKSSAVEKLEVPTTGYLMRKVQTLLKEKTNSIPFTVNSSITSIDDISIFLGAKIEPVFHIPSDSVDEELTDRIKKVIKSRETFAT